MTVKFLEDYQNWLEKGDPEHIDSLGLWWPGLGIAAEAGELVGEIEKAYRKDGGHVTETRRDAIIKEAGDVLWFMGRTLNMLGITYEEVFNENVAKLEERWRKHNQDV